MKVGIDASNLRGGGGITHLAALLSHLDAAEVGVPRVVVWGPRAALDGLADRSWLIKANTPELEGSATSRLAWRQHVLPKTARKECDVLFAPGGLCTDKFHPVVTMSRNMLPFQLREMSRYGVSKMLVRLAALRFTQRRSFRTADGVIFLSRFAQDTVLRATGAIPGQTTVIPHGVEQRFFQEPRPGRASAEFTADNPMRLLYVSIIDVYKHQGRVAEAVARLRGEGLPISVQFVGTAYPAAGDRLKRRMHDLDPQGKFLHYDGAVEHANLPGLYRSADAFVFASSCENLPNILLEAMASGLPIACSNRLPMPEVLGPAGIYFDPLRPVQIADVLRQLFHDAELRRRLAIAAFRGAQRYSWNVCARETFNFLSDVYSAHSVDRRPNRPRQSVRRRKPVVVGVGS